MLISSKVGAGKNAQSAGFAEIVVTRKDMCNRLVFKKVQRDNQGEREFEMITEEAKRLDICP